MAKCCHPLGLGYVPIALVVVLVIAVGTSYLIAVLHDDVAVIFPYISDTGGKPPESCIFAQFVNLSSLLLLSLIYIRFKEVDTIEGLPPEQVRCLNKAGLVLGILASLGLSIVGNFQDTNVLVVHDIGSVTFFVCMTIYCIIHTRITYLLQPDYSRLILGRIRLILSIILVIVLVTCISTKYIANNDWIHHHNVNDTRPLWKPTDGGYQLHVISASFEWALTFCLALFSLTLFSEFRRVTLGLHMFLHVEPFTVLDDDDDSNMYA